MQETKYKDAVFVKWLHVTPFLQIFPFLTMLLSKSCCLLYLKDRRIIRKQNLKHTQQQKITTPIFETCHSPFKLYLMLDFRRKKQVKIFRMLSDDILF